eukprot:1831713-Rhodomonas_salina.4
MKAPFLINQQTLLHSRAVLGYRSIKGEAHCQIKCRKPRAWYKVDCPGLQVPAPNPSLTRRPQRPPTCTHHDSILDYRIHLRLKSPTATSTKTAPPFACASATLRSG